MLKTLNVWKDEQTELRVETCQGDEGEFCWVGALVEISEMGIGLKLKDTGAVVAVPIHEIRVIGREADEWEIPDDDEPAFAEWGRWAVRKP